MNVSTKTIKLKKLTVTAMLTAIAFLCVMLFKFEVLFLTFDLKDAVLAVIAFLYGPLYGVISAISVAFLEFISFSDTGIYGLIMNALSSVTFSFICGIIYKYRRTLLGAVLGTVTAVFAMTAVMLVANIFITPYYMHVESKEVIALIPTLFLPFNLIKGVVNAASTMIIYKPITTALKKVGLSAKDSHYTDVKKFVVLSVISAVIAIVAILMILYVLHGDFSFGKSL